MGMVTRKDSWEQDDVRRVRAEKSEGETKTVKGGIHLSTVVQVSEERIEKVNVVRSVPAVEEGDLEKGKPPNHAFRWV
jgi:hypothetical protein